MIHRSSATRVACIVVVALFGSLLAGASEPVFSRPLHLTRVIDDGLSGTSTTVEEYCVGNRVIAIRGEKTSIADYATSELTEIDRANATWSVTRFDEIAKAWLRGGNGAPAVKTASADVLNPPAIESLGGSVAAGRAVERYAVELDTGPQAKTRIAVDLDSQIVLSREAIEVLVGAAWPNQRRREDDMIIEVSRGGGVSASSKSESGTPRFRLPLNMTISYEIAGEIVEVKNRITRVGHETPPPGMLSIPAGATRIESAIVRSKRMLDELDRLPTTPPDLN